MQRHQLHLMPGWRALQIERHDFYVAQVKARVFSNFTDMDAEATRAANETYDHIMQQPGDDFVDPFDVADAAREAGMNHYSLLHDLHEQMILGSLAGCFHQWEKAFRDFLDNELRYTVPAQFRTELVWKYPFVKLLGEIRHFGWDPLRHSSFEHLDAIRLIVNVHKHGNGQSLAELRQAYPKFVRDPLPEFNTDLKIVRYDWVHLTEAELEELVTLGIRQFWLDFPEVLYCPPLESTSKTAS